MTTLLRHRINDLNRHISIERTRGRGDPCNQGQAYSLQKYVPEMATVPIVLFFSDEPKADGLTTEALLAVVLDRLECEQRGAGKNRERALAVTKIEEAFHWLRTMAEY